jgi:hypothetical protein
MRRKPRFCSTSSTSCANLGEALDTVRKSEYARLSGRDRPYIKGQKYTLEAFALAIWPLGMLLRQRRDRHRLAVITLAAQQAEKRAFEQFRVKPVGLGAPVLAC